MSRLLFPGRFLPCVPSPVKLPVSSKHLFASSFTGAIPEEQLLPCGASDCLMATASTNSTSRPSQELIYTLLGVYTGTCSAPGTQAKRAHRLPGLKRPPAQSMNSLSSPAKAPQNAFSWVVLSLFHMRPNAAALLTEASVVIEALHVCTVQASSHYVHLLKF